MCWINKGPDQYYGDNPESTKYPINLDNYYKDVPNLESYKKIQNFLINEKEIELALFGLESAVLEGGVSTPQAFENFLAWEEERLGFLGVYEAVGFMSRSAFMGEVGSKKSIDDRVNTYSDIKKHGRSTHRVQWILIAWKFGSTLGTPVAEIYRNISWADNSAKGSGNPSLPPALAAEPPTLWDVLVDRGTEVCDATSPEFLRGEWLPAQGDFSRLRQVWR